MKSLPSGRDRPLSTSALLSPSGAASSPLSRALSLVAQTLGPGIRAADRTAWNMMRTNDTVVRLEVCGPPRLFVSIIDISKPGLRAVRMIDIYDEAGLVELADALAELAAQVAPLPKVV